MVKKKTKFTVCVSIEIEYDMPDLGLSTPFTCCGTYVNENGEAVIVADCGKIVESKINLLERKGE